MPCIDEVFRKSGVDPYSFSTSMIRLCKAVSLCAIGIVAMAQESVAQGVSVAPDRDAASSACGSVASIAYDDYEGTVNRLRVLYRTARYAELDLALDCLTKSPRTFRSGRMGAGAAYWLFRRELSAPGVVRAEAEAAVHAWKSQRPTSIFAEFATLRLRYALAWTVRGSAYSSQVPAERMDSFVNALFDVERALQNASTELRNTPLWHNLLLATVLDSPRSSTKSDEVLSTGLRRWPKYYDFYEVALSRMVPRWGGSWSAVDRFIVQQAAARKVAEGDSLYARLYWNVIATGAPVSETLVAWPRMKASLEELIERYPDPVHKNIAASFACVFGDMDYARRSWARLSPAEVNGAAWIRGTSPGACPR